MPEIAALHLEAAARDAAVALKNACPEVVFTSGRRTRGQQAAAMAANIVRSGDRSWIAESYVPSAARDACQQWVDAHPRAKTETQLMAGLTIVLHGLSDADVGRISKHLAGLAFDVEPVADEAGGAAVKEAIRALPGLTKFIDSEGGLVVWHAQFG